MVGPVSLLLRGAEQRHLRIDDELAGLGWRGEMEGRFGAFGEDGS